jgi:DNA (cytosine-5)-methyltransferase 1
MSHKFLYKWNLADGYPAKGIEKHNLKVFGTFICGGGSSMGYKLAGFDHLGGVEIDPPIADIYKTNHNPKYLFVEDIRDFAKRNKFPEDLYNLDILDGSPPCSSFSMAGNREKDWGKAKVFREGQADQRLDDLFFDYIKLAKKLQPKVVIAENVKGMLAGNAKIYCKKIKEGFEEAGYQVQLFLLNAATMEVPQKRERVFFVCQRNDLKLPKLELKFNKKPIKLGEFLNSKDGKELNRDGKLYSDWLKRQRSDKNFGDICLRNEGKMKSFGRVLLKKEDYAPTIVAGNQYVYFDDFREVSNRDICQIGSYPLDYNFKKIDPKYLIGMSVPPVMTAQVSYQIYLQWFKK